VVAAIVVAALLPQITQMAGMRRVGPRELSGT